MNKFFIVGNINWFYPPLLPIDIHCYTYIVLRWYLSFSPFPFLFLFNT